jgi:CubicO group peptidase (beta-lactamase class C family)
MAFGAGGDMRRDTIFRIASMTKAVTATAVMMLIEEGKFRLDEPVDRLLPELANRRVLRRLDAEVDDTVPAKRPLTVEDLLTFRCGLGMILAPPGRYPIQKAIADLGVNGVGFGPPDLAMPLDGDASMQKISSLPLFAQPGEDWLYTAGSNIQGVLVERASGQPLSRFFDERIFGPLGMKDTAFFVPPAKIDRLVHAYRSQNRARCLRRARDRQVEPTAHVRAGRCRVGIDRRRLSRVRAHVARRRPASGTGPAYARVSQGDEDQSPDCVTASRRGNDSRPRPRLGYGMSVVTDAIPGQPALGSFGWIGGYGSSWISDPSKDLTMILLTQHEFSSASGDPIHQEFQSDAYRALT